MKKSITTYPNKLNSKRKFDPVKFNEYLKGVNDYENKKKQKIENMRKEETEKELKKITNHPKINKGNIKYKINNKNYSTIERLYTQDLIKRKEKKQILTKIYTPTFKPNIYANKIMINKSNQKNLNNLDYSNHYNYRTEIGDDEDNFFNYDENSEFNYNNYDEEKEKEKRNQSMKKRMKERKEKLENENDLIYDNPKVENKLRSLLFKNRKNTEKRNKSVEKRKKTGFNLD